MKSSQPRKETSLLSSKYLFCDIVRHVTKRTFTVYLDRLIGFLYTADYSRIGVDVSLEWMKWKIELS